MKRWPKRKQYVKVVLMYSKMKLHSRLNVDAKMPSCMKNVQLTGQGCMATTGVIFVGRRFRKQLLLCFEFQGIIDRSTKSGNGFSDSQGLGRVVLELCNIDDECHLIYFPLLLSFAISMKNVE
ncbi:uncharacterized protein LOC130782003 [Actinidia eriantha]|uniref:uncharacterized protein LOC130782003 n=1 Tax=Actinidia eriantha TaxID=165200 RepID=UPI00258363AD|nr:uncharacterized protein LOC130782003 [Actinidia eriantha]